MYQRLRLERLVVLISLILMGCATTKMNHEIPIYSQDQEVFLGKYLKYRLLLPER